LFSLCEKYRQLNLDSALLVAQQAKNLAEHANHAVWKAKVWGLFAATYYFKDDFDRSIAYSTREIAAWHALGDADRQHRAIRQLGHSEYMRANYPQALDYLVQALRYFERRKHLPEYEYVLTNLFGLYLTLKDIPRARRYFNLWRTAAKRQPLNLDKEADNYRISTEFYTQVGDHRLALAMAHRAERSGHVPPLSFSNAWLTLAAANAHYELRQYNQARRYAAAALGISQQLASPETIVYSRLCLAKSLSQQGQHRPAAAALALALHEVAALHAPTAQIDAYEAAAAVAERARRFEPALAYSHRRHALKDSLFTFENKRRLDAAQTRHDEYRRQQQAAAQRHRLAQLRSEHRVTLLYLALLAVTAAVAVAGASLLARQRHLRGARDNAELRARQTELENQQLRAQHELRHTQQALEQKDHALTGLALQVHSKDQLVATVHEELQAAANRSEGAAQQHLHKVRQSLVLNAQAAGGRESLQQVLEQTHSRFFAALQQHCPDVTVNERRLAALLRLNLAIKDVAATLSISEAGVRKARYRLRQKLGLATDKELLAVLFQLGGDPPALPDPAAPGEAEAAAGLDQPQP
jgi:DNA-binding CsgD family transcriptional regulator